MITQQKSMPTYEYACKACGHQFEEIQKMSDPPVDVCPKCGEKAAQRLISQGNFILKGGGWYTTGGYGAPAKKSDDSSSGSSSSSSGKSDTKTETKPDAKPTGVPDAALPPALKSGGGSGGDGGSSTSRSSSGHHHGGSSSLAA